MKGFLHVRKIIVPRICVQEMHSHLGRVGELGFEGFALWAGVLEGDSFRVRQTCIPTQQGLRSDLGVCVTVDSAELHRINVWLYEQSLTLIAQIHSHPTDAYHSETDDAYPIATVLGSLSLVVPDFARDPFSLANCAIYRLMPPAQWIELGSAEAERLIVAED